MESRTREGGTKVGGWLRRLFKWAKDNLDFVPGVTTVCNIGEAVLDGLNLRIAFDGTITPAEEIILDEWDLKEFTPFYANLLMNLENISKTTLSIDEKVKFVNQMLLKIDAVTQYYAQAPKRGLSANALKFRQSYIEDSFDAIRTHLSTLIFLETYDKVSITDNTINVALNPLFILTNIDFTSSLYKVSDDVQELTPSVQLQSQNQPTITIATNSSGEPVAVVNNKGNLLKIVGFSIIAILGLRSAFKK